MTGLLNFFILPGLQNPCECPNQCEAKFSIPENTVEWPQPELLH